MPYPEHFAQLLQTACTPTVYWREHWEDDWEEADYLYPIFCEWTASPKMGSARLAWDYGRGGRVDEKEIGVVDPIDKIGWWVKIVIPQTELNDDWEAEEADDLLWVGRIVADKRNEASCPKRQTLECTGLECLLGERVARSSCDDGVAGECVIGRGLEFNGADRARPDAP